MSASRGLPAPELFVHGMGHFHPETVIDNTFLASLDIGTNDTWILEHVGIRTRRSVLPLDYIATTRNQCTTDADGVAMLTNAETGAHAARLALARAGVSTAEIGLVIAGGCSPQYYIPAEACRIAAELGITAPAFDLQSACSSFGAQIHYLRMMRPESLPDYVLIVNVENNTRTIDYNDRRTAVLWGDGSAAAVLSPRKPAALRVTDSLIGSDPSGWKKVVIPAGQHFQQDGQAVQGFAIRRTVAALREIAPTIGSPDSTTHFIGHQANGVMLESVCRRAGVDAARHWSNVMDFGNCGAAGAPSVLSQHWDTLPADIDLAMVVVGAGLTWAALRIQSVPGA